MKRTTSSDTTSVTPIDAKWDESWDDVSNELFAPPPAGFKSAAQLEAQWGVGSSSTLRRINKALKMGLIETNVFYVKGRTGRNHPTSFFRPLVTKTKRPAVSSGASGAPRR